MYRFLGDFAYMSVRLTRAEIVFVGDSLTQWFQTDGSVHWKKYFGHLNPVNLGVAGDTTDQTISRLNGGILGAMTAAKLSVLLIGTNDIGLRYGEDYISSQIQKIIDILQTKLEGTNVLLLGILPRRSLPLIPGKVNKLISKLENGNSVRFLDMTNQFSKNGKPIPQLYRPDQLHLSPDGYRVWAETMDPVVTEMLSKANKGSKSNN